MRHPRIFAIILLAAAPLAAATVSNRHIVFGINNLNHRFELLRTTGGIPDIPSDDNRDILQPRQPSLSAVYIFIDGKPHKLGLHGRSLRPPFVTNNDRIVSEWSFGKIIVRQTAQLVEGPFSGLPDSVRFSCEIRNLDSVPHTIGAKVVFDTFLGPNDAAPFLVPLTDAVGKEHRAVTVPDYLVGLDTLRDPAPPFHAVLRGPGIAGPDALVFAAAEKLNNSGWDIPVEPDKPLKDPRTGLPDTAFALFWGPVTFPPAGQAGSAKRLSTILGLAVPTIQTGDPIDLALVAPRHLRSPSFSVIAVLRNNNAFRSVKNATIQLGLPPGCTVSSPNPVLGVPQIAPGTERVLSYTIDASAMPEGEHTVSLTVNAEANNAAVIASVRRRIRR